MISRELAVEYPEYFNIGAACTDAHLASAVATHVAMIVEDDHSGIVSMTFQQLAEYTDKFSQLLRIHGISVGEAGADKTPNSWISHRFFWER